MARPPSTWKRVDPDVDAYTFTYSFGSGISNAFALAIDGGWMVVSPPCNVGDDCFEGIEKLGKVRALVAPNAFHNLGIAGWKARYPGAPVFAPAQSVARVKDKSKVDDVRPVAEAASLLGPHVELVDMPFYRTGEVLIRLHAGERWVWFTTDILMNMAKAPPGFPFNLLFKWTRSAPGFRVNGFGTRIMVKDRKKLHLWLAEQGELTPPTLLVPCHGDTVRMSPPGSQLRGALDLE